MAVAIASIKTCSWQALVVGEHYDRQVFLANLFYRLRESIVALVAVVKAGGAVVV